MRRPRLTLRLAMILVAICSIPFALLERRNRFQRLTADHVSEQVKLIRRMGGFHGSMTDPFYPRALFHNKMTDKHERAARYPWLLVDPDPPEPR